MARTMTTVLILAAGEQKRWAEDSAEPKQLADIGGESLILRIIRQVKERDELPIVVTHDYAITRATVESAIISQPGKYCRWVVETVLSTLMLWGDSDEPVVVLFGDVIFSKVTMDLILGETETLPKFYGNGCELFAVRFCPDDLLCLLVKHLGMARHGGYKEIGRFWNVYRALIGVELDKHVIHDNPPYFAMIEDWTNDIDNMGEYVTFQREVIDAGKLDDLREDLR